MPKLQRTKESFFLKVGSDKIEVKLTEKALETCYYSNKDWQKIREEYLKAKRNYNALDSLYWAAQKKGN